MDIDRSALIVGAYSGNVSIECNGITEVVPVAMEVVNEPPATPSNPSPADGAVDQVNLGLPLTVTMTGSDLNCGDTLTCDVYISDNQALVDRADPSVRVSDDQPVASYQSPALDSAGTYYWRISATAILRPPWDRYGVLRPSPCRLPP